MVFIILLFYKLKYILILFFMYNTNHKCTYDNFDIFLDADEDVSEEEQDNIRNIIYRQDLLTIFNIDEYNESLITNAIHELYEKVKSCNELVLCMRKLAGNFLSEDEEMGLMILFAYDYMSASHLCISEFLENGTISKKRVNILNDLVFC